MSSTEHLATPPGPRPLGREGMVQGIRAQTLREIEVAWADHLGHTLGKRLPAAGFMERAQRRASGSATPRWPGMSSATSTRELASPTGIPASPTSLPHRISTRSATSRGDPGAARSSPTSRPTIGNWSTRLPVRSCDGSPSAWPSWATRPQLGVEIEFFLLNEENAPSAAPSTAIRSRRQASSTRSSLPSRRACRATCPSKV